MTYHDIDASPFGTKVKLCFDQDGADAILTDHDIDFAIDAFDLGIAETHYISDGRDSIIVVIIDPAKCDSDQHFASGVVAHEAYHVACRIFEHIGQPLYDVGEEVFAYTIEHIVKQMSAALEKELNARKASRSKTKQTRQRKGWPKLQVDQQRDGGTGSDSATEQSSILRGIKDPRWKSITEASYGVQPDQPAGAGSIHPEKL